MGADYIYIINRKNKKLSIIDKNLGNKSVTNDIENVVKQIGLIEDINPDEYTIVYRDSELNWDGWDNKTQTFVSN